jgi:drug/metabolite transporter (DMT)-like permease
MKEDPPQTTLSNWKLGFALALTTALFWGILPIALKVALTELDAWTITWCRFAGAGLVVGLWLAFHQGLPTRKLRDRKIWRWLIPGCLGLIGNYVLYVLGLRYTSPAVAQVVMQIAPILLLVFGMFVFHERFSRLQWVGFAVLVIGLAVFFNRRLPELANPAAGWSFGVLLLVISAVSWAIYGVSQKQLLQHLDSAQILFLVYVGAALILLPTATLTALFHLHRPAFIALSFGVLNTVVAYGAFGMALEVWEVSRVSSVAASAPLFTVAGSLIAAQLAFSWVTPEALNALSVLGAFSVVAGSMISALGSRRKKGTSRAS